jgi:diguanylate cyclase (GGDEF)-like protein
MDSPVIGIARRIQWMLLALVLALVAAMLAAGLAYERQRIIDEQFERLSTKARVIDANIVRQLEGVSNTLRAALTGDDVLLDKGGPFRLPDPHLKALAEATLGARTFLIIDAHGDVLASSRPEGVGANVAQREYFITPSRAPNAGALYLSRPFKTPLGVYSINVARVTTHPDGRLEKVATATLDPDFFATLLASVRFDPDVWVSLAHIGGELVLRFPQRPDLLGSQLNQPGSFFHRHLDSGRTETMLSGHAKATGLPGWMAQRTIAAPQLQMQGALVVAVARAPSAALKSWYTLLYAGTTIWGVVALASCVALVFFQRYQTREGARLAAAETLRQKAEEEVRRIAYIDPLTRLPNRRLLLDRMSQIVPNLLRQQHVGGLLFLDLDGFKQLNDTLGHDKGDQLLQEVARRVHASIRSEDTAARWGGDEFVVVLNDLGTDQTDAAQRLRAIAEKILGTVGQRVDLNGHDHQCSCSIGGTLFGDREEPTAAILKRADDAMYQAKTSGKNAYRQGCLHSDPVGNHTHSTRS